MRSPPARFLAAIPALSVAALAAACGSSQPTPQTAPPPSATSVASASASAPLPHAPAPPPPPAIETASLDTSVSPCDNFYQYTCGGWLNAHPIPEDQVAWGRGATLAEENETALRGYAEGDATKPGALPYAKQIGDFYASCMDEATAEKQGTRPLAAELKRIAAVHDPLSFAHELAHLHAMDVGAFFETGAAQDFKDATQMIGEIEQGGLGLPDRDYFVKDTPDSLAIRAKYAAHVAHLFEFLGDKPEKAEKEATAVLALEKMLALPQLSSTDHHDPLKIYHPVDRAGLAQISPTFAWDVYFKDLGIGDAKTFNVVAVDYLAAFDKLVAEATPQTWEEQIRPYLRTRFLRRYARRLSKKFVDEDFDFIKTLYGQEKIEPRWKRCVREVDDGMGEALAIPFVKEKLGADGKKMALDMVSSIESAMQNQLAHLTWMDDATRARALDKVRKVSNMIGYPDKFRNYDALKIERGAYAANVMRANEVESRRQLAEIGKPVDHTEWSMTPPTVNAYYSPTMNHMVFPAGILQPPFFSVSAPLRINFGAIGSIMGHELTHGFDNHGREFDGNGNLTDWWTPSVGAEFDRRAACVVDQFNGYLAVDDVHVNGKLTNGENIADLGGLKLALASVRAKETPASATAEADREFFVAFGQAWCEHVRPEFTRVMVQTDPHAPSHWRVNGPLSNMPEFATAFSCQAGDAMVRPPATQCTVW